MQARCPHCSNVFTTERSGPQFCPSCGQQINVPGPASGAPANPPAPGAPSGPAFGSPLPPQPGPTTQGPTPWERRGEANVGFIKGLWETAKGVSLDPDRFWKSTRPTGLWEGLSFAWVVYAIGAIMGLPFSFVTGNLQSQWMSAYTQGLSNLPPEAKEVFNRMMGLQNTGFRVGAVVGAIIIFPLVLIVVAAIVHLSCMIFGCAKNGFEATVRSMAYGLAPLLLVWIPCIGGLASIYALVLQIWGISRLQNTTGVRATLAVLLPFLVTACCCCPALSAIGLRGAFGGH